MKPDRCHETPLDLVLACESNHPKYDSVVAHLDHCSDCQDRLDGLVADEAWWNQAKSALSDSKEMAMPTDLPRADTIVVTELGSPQEIAQPAELLDVAGFLSPPRHPEMLGRIGKYEVEREVGRGGMGIVVKGFDSELNRPVAIKLLAPHLASVGTARQRFIREARAAAAVVHDNVVAIHGIETEGRLPAIVMPLVSGSSLRAHVEQHGAMESVDVVRVGMQIASGLAAAHAQGLVHRDIKPANILLENDLNRVQITDFGLARAAHDSNLTHSGIIAGTPQFMSPEQALGETVDQRSDLFSLGAVLYFVATGELPFAGTTPMGVLQRVCNVTPRRVREINPQIPEQLESIIEKLLEKAPRDRFESAEELRQYLADYIAHLQQPTKRKPPKRIRTAARRRRSRLLATGTLVVAMLVAMGWFMWSRRQPPVPTTTMKAPTANLLALDLFDRQLQEVEVGVATLESSNPALGTPNFTTTSVFGSDQDQSMIQLGFEIQQLETPRSAGEASIVERELQSIDASIRRLEQQSARPQQPSSQFQGQ
ncbi:MAG: serine/threonine-protein kinase [Planctomycetaceae bacterium]